MSDVGLLRLIGFDMQSLDVKRGGGVRELNLLSGNTVDVE